MQTIKRQNDVVSALYDVETTSFQSLQKNTNKRVTDQAAFRDLPSSLFLPRPPNTSLIMHVLWINSPSICVHVPIPRYR